MYKMGFRPLVVLLMLTAFLGISAQTDAVESDEGELITNGGTEDKNGSTMFRPPVTTVPGSEKTESAEDSRESNVTSSTKSNSTEDDGPEAEDSEGKDFLEMLTLIGIIVGAIVAVIIALTVIIILVKKMSGGYSP
ncbi:podoplanin-like [Narcine bancroftii]|uniref:podoplanin-like n=1 Tax=Narcine bancroftii TaxID=1343680 RepID=UPI003831298C